VAITLIAVGLPTLLFAVALFRAPRKDAVAVMRQYVRLVPAVFGTLHNLVRAIPNGSDRV
jgi:uncharacterized protein (DUF2461 family)